MTLDVYRGRKTTNQQQQQQGKAFQRVFSIYASPKSGSWPFAISLEVKMFQQSKYFIVGYQIHHQGKQPYSFELCLLFSSAVFKEHVAV